MTKSVTPDVHEITAKSNNQARDIPLVMRRHEIKLCPVCRHPMVADEVARALPRVSRRVYEAVRDAGADGISWREITAKVYADDPTGGPTTNSVSVLISRTINPHLRRYGLVLDARGGPGSVYKLIKCEP